MLPKPTHVSLIPIKNMNRAIKFYTNALSAVVNMRGTGDMKDGWASISVGKAELWLIVPAKRESMKFAYNVFKVKNIRTAVKSLRNRSVKFETAEEMGPGSKVDGPITYSPYGASAFFKDSEGNMLMLFQEPKT